MKKRIEILFLPFLLCCGILSASIPGDIDDSGQVNAGDIEILAGQWLDVPATPSADIAPPTPDNFVDFLDFSVIAAHWLMTAPDPNEMAFIPGGEFEMGNHFPDSDPNESQSPEEFPVHAVMIDSFYMGKYEVTNGQFCQFLNASLLDNTIEINDEKVYGITGSEPNQLYCYLSGISNSLISYSGGTFSVLLKSGRDMTDDPIVLLTWYGAVAYCNWRSEQDGYESCYDLSTWECDFSRKGYRLPTEAEWEYAARGGQANPYTRFGWGNIIDHTLANYDCYWRPGDTGPYYDYDNGQDGFHPDWDDGIEPYTAPVGTFVANGFGLHDMAGNIWEWCNDWYDSNYYSTSPYSNPTGPASGIGRALRGGSWRTKANTCRSAERYGRYPDEAHIDRGFRMCLDVQ